MSNITDRLNKITQTLNSQNIATFAHDAMVKHTPIKTGNARNRTIQQGTTIKADYPYAQELENNLSPQTKGKGIIQPTIDDVRAYVKAQTGINIKI